MTEIGVIGAAGYVGLVTAVGFASLGHKVISMDIDRQRLELLRNGKSAVYEEGLEPILRQLIDADQISFTDDQSDLTRDTRMIFIAVGTPSLPSGEADLSALISVVEKLRDEISQYTVVVVKSTVPVGSMSTVVDILSEKLKEGKDFDVVSNPEFLQEGKGLIDFFAPSRIIVGSDSTKALEILRDLYQPLLDAQTVVETPWVEPGREIPYIETDAVSAQLTKYAANAFLATRISYINEIAGISEIVGGDMGDIVRGLGLDPRIGSSYLRPGIGFGGPCLDKDLRALITIAEANSYDPILFNGVLQRNELQLELVMNKIKNALGSDSRNKRVALLGLAFKEGTNDVRHSLSLKLFKALKSESTVVVGHDRLAASNANELEPELAATNDLQAVLTGSDVIVILNSESDYANIKWGEIRYGNRPPHVIDTRGVINGAEMSKLGIKFDVLGS